MSFDQLLRAIENPPPRPLHDFDRKPRGERTAAVLMLFSEKEDPEIAFVRRASTMRTHAGQIALPGGRVDPGETPSEAAVRETWEEVGIEAAEIEVFGELPPLWVPASNYDVTTVLGVWPGGSLRAVDPAETESVHQYSVSQLASAEVRRTSQHPLGFHGPAFVLPDAFIWGLTAHLLDWVLELGGWAQQWDREEIVDIPRQYLRDGGD